MFSETTAVSQSAALHTLVMYYSSQLSEVMLNTSSYNQSVRFLQTTGLIQFCVCTGIIQSLESYENATRKNAQPKLIYSYSLDVLEKVFEFYSYSQQILDSFISCQWKDLLAIYRITMSNFQVERDYDREEKDDFESDREDSVTHSDDMTSSPCAQHNGSYKTHNEEDTPMGADGTKWLLQPCRKN